MALLKTLFSILLVCLTLGLRTESSEDEFLLSFSRHLLMGRDPFFQKLDWKNIGPTFCGGRVVDVEGYENHPGKFWAATASGGLWLSEDWGQTWRSSFNREATASIGDIAVSQGNENLIWLGSGESNSQSHSYPGCGVFKSVDAGRTWKHMGLAATRHIARVLINPQDSDIVYVAALGNLFSANADRGVFKTIDGGQTWEKVLFISNRTGVIDLAMDPRQPNVLYAAAWQKERKPWNFIESGNESTIYKTANGGKSWEQLGAGLLANRNIGRIGLAVSGSNPAVLYALLDNQDAKTEGRTAAGVQRSGLTVASLAAMTNEHFLLIKDKTLELFLVENEAPKVYSPAILKSFVSSGRLTSQIIAQMLFDANNRRLNPNTIGAEVYRSSDGGRNWQKVNKDYIEDMYYTYGFYFGQIRVAPNDENRVYILGVSAFESTDGGRTFKKIAAEQRPFADALLHRDHHALWIDPKNPQCLILGNDGGINISSDGGQNWRKINNLSISQCYTVTADNAQPANIFIGTQDNGVLMAPHALTAAWTEAQSWRMLLGGDGAFVTPLPGNPQILFAAAQFGALVRLEAGQSKPLSIKPSSPQFSEPYRFNWLSPLLASRLRPGDIYFAANKLLRSSDQGASWQEISFDLSDRENITGNTPYATITAIAESELKPGSLYAGTDDGNVWLKAGRESPWRKISQALPKKWVSRIVASRYRAEKVYLTMNSSKENDCQAYVFASENFGLDWESLRDNLPAEPLNVLAEDPDNEQMLYLGSDRGLYVSLDAGASWRSLQGNLPTVPVVDLFIHRRDKIMIVATHGRGVYVLPLAEIKKRLPAPKN